MFVTLQIKEGWITAKYIHDASSVNSKMLDHDSMLSQSMKTQILSFCDEQKGYDD